MDDQTTEQMIKDLGADKAPRVTPESIEEKIDTELFMRDAATGYTVCKIAMKNGFQFVGTSGCASPENYNQEIGDRLARAKAFDQIWSHEGYMLKEMLYKMALMRQVMADGHSVDVADPTDSQAVLGQKAAD